MNFLIDNALSPIIAKGLKEAGFESMHFNGRCPYFFIPA